MTAWCRVCRRPLDGRTRMAGGEVCFDCATAPRDWLAEAAGDARQDLINLAARYPDRFEWRDGRLYPRRANR